jgi:ESCRT-II complex subunit VPS36
MEYSPFDCLAAAETTRSGLLKCWESEIEICWVSNGELRSTGSDPLVPLNAIDDTTIDTTKTKWIDRCAELDILVTSHRLAFVKTGSGNSGSSSSEAKEQRIIRYIHHSSLFSLATESLMFKSPKLILSCSIGELILAFTSGNDRTKRRDECHDQLKIAWQRKQWETTTSPIGHSGKTTTHGGSSTTGAPSSGRRRVGVDAILTANTRRHQQAAILTTTAFGGDAEQLLSEAVDLVQIIEKYVATLDRQQNNNDDDGNDSNNNQQLVNLMQGMGMMSSLHRDDQLARQLADFLRPKFQEHHDCHVITLTDVYCWFNRARGFSHLLSPDELLTAISSMEALKLGISRQTFASGLVVLRQDDGTSDDAVLHQRFLDLCHGGGGGGGAPNHRLGYITALQVSQVTQVPAVLALEQLQWAENQGVLVRDETVESIRFYPNQFNSNW